MPRVAARAPRLFAWTTAAGSKAVTTKESHVLCSNSDVTSPAATVLPWAPTALVLQRRVSDGYGMPPPQGDRSPLGDKVWVGVALTRLVPNPGGQGLVLRDEPAVLHGLGIALFALAAPVLVLRTVRTRRLWPTA